VVASLHDLDLEGLRRRIEQLDEWTRAVDSGQETRELFEATFPFGDSPDLDYNDYHRVRNEYDRRASEEFDLGQ
jgi:hypothetical protein